MNNTNLRLHLGCKHLPTWLALAVAPQSTGCSFFVSGPGTDLLTNERIVRGRKGPGYLERKFQGTNGPGNKWSTEEKVCRVYSFPWTFVPGNERSWERIFQGMNGPENESSIMRTNSLENECSSILPVTGGACAGKMRMFIRIFVCILPTDNYIPRAHARYETHPKMIFPVRTQLTS